MTRKVLISLTGNIGTSVEIKDSANGNKFGVFSIAHQEGDRTIWYEVFILSQSGEDLNYYKAALGVGSFVEVVGFEEVNYYEKDGKKKESRKLSISGKLCGLHVLKHKTPVLNNEKKETV